MAKGPAVIKTAATGRAGKKTETRHQEQGANGLSNKPTRPHGPQQQGRGAFPFYINVKDNDFLDKAKDPDNVGYCVFGKVVEGTEIVDKVFAVKTNKDEAPVTDVVIKSVRLEK